MPNNNPFSDLASALGGAVFGDPRQQALGQFYGQRSRGQTLKNQALQTGIDEHDALVKSLADNPDMLNSIYSGEGYSSAKGNLGKEQRAADSHKSVVDAFAEIYKQDPVLHNQYQVGRTGADIRSEANIANDTAAENRLVEKDKRLTDALALLGQGTDEEKELARNINLQLSGPDMRALKRIPLDKNESIGKVNVSNANVNKAKEEVNKTKKEIKSIEGKLKNANADSKQKRKLARKKAQLEENLIRAKTKGEEAKSSSASQKVLLEIDKLNAEIAFKKQQTQTQKSLEGLRDSKEKVYALKNKIAKTRFGKRGLKAKEFVAAVDKTLALLTKEDITNIGGMQVMHDGVLKSVKGLSFDQITEVAEDHVLGVTSLDIPEDQGQDVSAALGGVPQVSQAPQTPEPDLARALGGVSQGGVPQSVIAKLSNVKGADLENLYKETRNLPDGDPLRKYVEQLYLGQ